MADAEGPDQGVHPPAGLFAPSPLIAALGLFLLPLTWWAPIGIAAPLAAIGFVLLLLRYFVAPHVQSPAPVRAPYSKAVLWMLLAGAAIAGAAFILDAGASLRIAVAAFVVTRALLLFPAARASLIWLAAAHVAASFLSGIALGAGAALSVALISVAALLLDLARWSHQNIRQSASPVTPEAPPGVADDADGATVAHDQPVAETTSAGPASPAEIAREASDTEAANRTSETEPPGAADKTTEPAAPTPAPQKRNEAIDIVRGAAALAATFVAGLLLIVQTPSAPLATRSMAPETQAPSEEEIDTEWRTRFPWAFPDLPRPDTRDRDLIFSECERAQHYDEIELHALLEPQHEDAGGWTSVAAQFERPALEAAPADAAETVFGAPCSNDARLRVMDGAKISVPESLDFTIGEAPVVVGAVHQLSTARGPLLLARAWSNESGIILLIATSIASDARVIAISNRSAYERGGRLFAIEGAVAQLWYGALSEDAHSASAVDIIDVSADTPQNTGSITAWGASTCGQTLGDPLYPAEENCVEAPAWAYWLVEARYSSEERNRIEVIWNVRRQFGEAGEPATYEAAFDELMHGAYERHEGGWRLTRFAGPELNGLQAQLTPVGSDSVVQQ